MSNELNASKEPKETATAKLQFVLKGFHHESGFRVFLFDGVASDRSRTVYSVRADVALSRTFGIQLQELPLLCRALLEQRDLAEDSHTLIYSEQEMRRYSVNRIALRDAAALKRKPPRKPPIENIGAAWRAPQQP